MRGRKKRVGKRQQRVAMGGEWGAGRALSNRSGPGKAPSCEKRRGARGFYCGVLWLGTGGRNTQTGKKHGGGGNWKGVSLLNVGGKKLGSSG